MWNIPSNYQTDRSANPKLLLSPTEPYSYALSDDRSVAYLWDDQGSVWKMMLSSGKRERLSGNFPGLTRASSVSISYDKKEILYVQRRLDAKLVMIENLFK